VLVTGDIRDVFEFFPEAVRFTSLSCDDTETDKSVEIPETRSRYLRVGRVFKCLTRRSRAVQSYSPESDLTTTAVDGRTGLPNRRLRKRR